MLLVLKKTNILLAVLLLCVAWLGYVMLTAVSPASTPIAPDTIVIDAGHGGLDSGGVSPNGIGEKNINLAVAFFLKEMAENDGMSVIMTRTEDISLHKTESSKIRVQKRSDLEIRRKVLNETGAAAFISIHLNKFEQSKYRGAQVFYANNDSSRALGLSIQKNLKEGLADGNNREAKSAPSSVYIFKGTSATGVIVECGFLSNPEEEILLNNEEYQKKLAYYIYRGFKNFKDTYKYE